jgi:hypothetical protein
MGTFLRYSSNTFWLCQCAGSYGRGEDVLATPEIDAFERGVRPLLRIVLPEKAEAVIRLRAAPKIQARIEELAGKSTEGQLTELERAEYAGYVRANKFIAVLQTQARQLIGAAS